MQHGDADERADALASELEESTGDAVIVVDSEDRIVRWSEVAEGLFKVSAAQALGRAASELLTLSAAGPAAPTVLARLRQRERCHGETLAVGEQPALAWTARPVLGPSGNFGGALYRARAHVAAGADSLETLSFARRALDAAPFSVLVVDARRSDLPIVYASGALERLTGFTREEVLGKNARIFQGRFGDQPALAVIRRAILVGHSCDVVIWNQRKDGAPYQNRLSLTPVRDARGAVSHFIGVQEDVSAREEMVARLFRAQSRELAQQMLSGAVHDLRNLLTIVSAEVGIARDDAAHLPAVTESLDAAGNALQEAGTLVRLLLSPITRVNAMGGTAAVRDVFQTVKVLARHALPRSVHVELEVDERAAATHVVGDRGVLEHVITNLMLNAIDAMPGGGRIRVLACVGVPSEIATAEERTGLDQRLTIQIADDGPGMNEDVLARVFEPYFTTKGAGEGLGLGLSTSATLVRAAGGKLRARSRVGAGSTFYVTLPITEGVLPGSSAHRAAAGALPGVEAVVVEPDAGVRHALCTFLRRRGADVRDAPDVELARALGSTLGPAAILIVDGSTLLEGGVAFVDEWLSGPARRALVLGGVSSSTRETTPARSMWLPKPFDPEQLLLAVEELARAAPPALRLL